MSEAAPAGHRGIASARSLFLAVMFVASGVVVARCQEVLDESRQDARSANEKYVEPPLESDARDHWSFRPLARHELPVVRDRNWARDPLDRFIQQRHEQKELAPLPPAARRLALRRVSFDLRGVPPDADELMELEAEEGRVDGMARAVDRWLASPRFGERWARPWLDLARFAETDGFEHDLVRAEAWRYRDWVVDAWNQDLPFDQFMRWQIAGDLLAPDEPAAAIATGFLLSGPDMPDLNRQDERRHMVLNEMTGTLGAVFLGLQVGCAECHDHKYDPLSLADFYRLRACLESTELFRDQPLGRSGEVPSVDRARYLQASAGATEWRGRVLREGKGSSPVARWYERGDFRRPGGSVVPAAPRVLADQPLGSSSEPLAARAKLAEWLAGDSQPLVDRVAVNRLWQELFGAGLVTTPSDFGQLGSAPSHPELLDWLVERWRRQGRSPKRWIRDVVLSATYGQASGVGTVEGGGTFTVEQRENLAANFQRARRLDAHNRWLVGQNRKRLDGESLRDTLLMVSGEFVAERGGPGVRPPLPRELVETLLKGQWEVSPRAADYRRASVYLFVRRNLPHPWLAAFDRGDATASCPVRVRTTTAPQALALWNSEFTWSCSESLAGRLLEQPGGDEARLQELARRCLSRQFTEEERAELREWLATERQGAGGERRAWSNLVRTVVCLHEFLYLD